MILSENPAAAAELVRRANDYRTAKYPRAEGVHVSDLVYCRRKAWYRKNLGIQEEFSVETLLIFLLGHGFHDLLEQEKPERKLAWTTPEGITIHGTADAIVFEEDVSGIYPHEFKTTRASVNKPVIDTQHYFEQAASYAVMDGTDRARLSVVYINGAYKPPTPAIRTWDARFSPDQLARWSKEMRVRAVDLNRPEPPILYDSHRSWECKFCPFESKKGGPCPGGPGDETHFFQLDGLPEFIEEVSES